MKITTGPTKKLAREAVQHARKQGLRWWPAYEAAKRYIRRKASTDQYDEALQHVITLLEI